MRTHAHQVFSVARGTFKITWRFAWHLKVRDANDQEEVGDVSGANGTSKKSGDWLELFKDQ